MTEKPVRFTLEEDHYNHIEDRLLEKTGRSLAELAAEDPLRVYVAFVSNILSLAKNADSMTLAGKEVVERTADGPAATAGAAQQEMLRIFIRDVLGREIDVVVSVAENEETSGALPDEELPSREVLAFTVDTSGLHDYFATRTLENRG